MATLLTSTNEELVRRQEKQNIKYKSNRSPSDERPSTFRYTRPQTSVGDPADIEKETKELWDAERKKIRGFEKAADYIADEMKSQIRPGLRFWEYLGLANPKIKKPRIWIPKTLVNCSGNQQFFLSTGTPHLSRRENRQDHLQPRRKLRGVREAAAE